MQFSTGFNTETSGDGCKNVNEIVTHIAMRVQRLRCVAHGARNQRNARDLLHFQIQFVSGVFFDYTAA
jgi:hypothetical protein